MKRSGGLFLLLLLLLPLAAPGAEPTPEEKALKEADEKLRKEVNAAIARGVAWLKSRQAGDGSFPGYESAYPMGPTALGLLALLHAGVPRSSVEIRKGFDHLRTLDSKLGGEGSQRREGRKVYSVSILIMALAQLPKTSPGDRYGPGQISKPDLDWMKALTAWLVDVQQGNGAWRYPYGGYDNSNTQYALLALKEARRVGIRVPDKVFEKALKHWLDEQERDGPKVRRRVEKGGDGVYGAQRSYAPGYDRARGWGYHSGTVATGAMTTAGVAAVAIARSEVRSRVLRAKAERSMRDGLAWLGLNFSVTENPMGRRRGQAMAGTAWHYYYLYGLERAGVLARVVWMGDHRWYAEGARYLVDEQLDGGGWIPGAGRSRRGGRRRGSGGDLIDSCFALLFLVRSTSHSFGVPTPRESLSLRGSDGLPDKANRDLFEAAFDEMAHLDDDAQRKRAREFAWLGPRVLGYALPLLHSEAASVRGRAMLILRESTGRMFGFDPDAPVAMREGAADHWTAWYLENRARLRLDPAGPVIR